MLAFVIVTPAFAQTEKDVAFSDVRCWDSNGELGPSEIAPLWNPAQEETQLAKAVLGYGPGWSHNFSGSGIGSVRCVWSVASPQRWRALEIEAASSGASLASVKLGGTEQLSAAQPLAPFKKFRTQFADELSNVLEITFSVPCSGGTCSLRLNEINILPITLEPAQLVSQDGVPRDVVFPSEPLYIEGTVGGKLYTCEGEKNFCAWIQQAKCKKKSWSDKDCVFNARYCIQQGWYGNIEVASKDDFDSGGCGSWVEKRGLKYLGAALMLASLIFPGFLSMALPLIGGINVVGGLGMAMMAYNVDMAWKDQWLGVTLAFVGGGIASYNVGQTIKTFTTSLSGGLGGTVSEPTAESTLTGLNEAIKDGAITDTATIDAVQSTTATELAAASTAAGAATASAATLATVEVARSYLLNQAFASLASAMLNQWVQGVVSRKVFAPAIAELFKDSKSPYRAQIEQFLSGLAAGLATPAIVAFTTDTVGDVIGSTVSSTFEQRLEDITALTWKQYSSEYIWKTIGRSVLVSLQSVLQPMILEKMCEGLKEKGDYLAYSYCLEVGGVVAGNLANLAIDVLNLSMAPTKEIGTMAKVDEKERKAVAAGGAVDLGGGAAVNLLDETSATGLNAINADTALRDGLLKGTLAAKQMQEQEGTVWGSWLLTLNTSQRKSVLDSSFLKLSKEERKILREMKDVGKLVASTRTWEVMRGAEALLAEYKRTQALYEDLGASEDAMREWLEASMNNYKCACYGYFSASPQYLSEGVAPTCTAMGGALGVVVMNVYDADKGRSVDSTTFPGRGWCTPDMDSYLAEPWKGALSIAIKNATVTARSHSRTTRDDGSFAQNTLAPETLGTWTVESRAAGNATSSLIGIMMQAAIVWSGIFEEPLAISGAIETATALADSLEAAQHLAIARQRILDLKSFLETVAAQPISATRPEIAIARDALGAILGAARTIATGASAAGHATTLGAPNGTIDTLQAAYGNISVLTTTRSLNLILAALDHATGVRDVLYDVMDKSYELSDKVNELPTSIATQYISPTELEWNNYCYHQQWLLRDFRACSEGSETISPSQLSMVIDVTWWYVNVTDIKYGGTVSFDFRKLSDDFTHTAAILDEIANETDATIATIGYGDALPANFLTALESARTFRINLSQRISSVNASLVTLAGTETEDGRLLAGTVTVCSQQYGWGGWHTVCTTTAAYVKDRQMLARAEEAIYLWSRLLRALDEADESATDAVYHAKLNKFGDPSIFMTLSRLTDLENALANISAEPIEANKLAIEQMINATNIDTLIADTSGGLVEGVTTTKLEVITPTIYATPEQNMMCGSGEPLRYNISVRVDAAWPRISVQTGWWTPFSVPYALRVVNNVMQNVTLADISNCNVQALSWWNYAAQIAVNITTNASSVPLVPGRGYYLQSASNCEIKFESSKFNLNANAQINLSAAGNSVSTARTLIGSAGHTVVYDSDSLLHKVFDPFFYFDRLNGNSPNNCPQLGYELYESDMRIDKSPGNWTWLLEARPMQSYPFTSEPVGAFADMVRPGRAYWIWGNKTCSLQPTLPGELQTSNIWGPKPVGFDVTFSTPTGWNGSVAGDIWSIDYDDYCLNNAMCASVGSPAVRRTVEVRPAATGAGGENIIGVSVSNRTYFANASTTVRYTMLQFTPMITADIARAPAQINYMLNITNTAPDFCQARAHNLYTEGPLGWNMTQTASAFELLPGAIGKANVTLSPKPGNAQSGWFITLASAEATERERAASEFTIMLLPQQPARDVASDGSHLFYSSSDGIYAFDLNNRTYSIIAPGGLPYGVAYANNQLYWIDGAAHKIMSYNISSRQIAAVASVSGATDVWYVAADNQFAYWVDNSTIKRANLTDGTISTVADNLDEATDLGVDSQSVYWVEPSRIRKVPKFGTCSGSTCAIVANISEALLGPSPGRLRTIAVDGGRIFAGASNAPLNEKDYNKILVVNASSGATDVVTKPYVDFYGFGGTELTGLAVDGNYIYWAADSIDRINKWARAAVFGEYVTVPGHNSAIASVEPPLLAAIAGVPVQFNVTVMNNNSADAPEPVNKFWIKDIQMPAGIELCASEFECESANAYGASSRRQALLARYESDSDLYRLIGRGESRVLKLWLKTKPTVPEGTVLRFNVTVGSIDPVMNGRASAALNITAPQAPAVEIVPRDPWECFVEFEQLEPGFISQNCSARYSIRITNPEALDASYTVSISAPSGWNAVLDQETVNVPGRTAYGTGWNQRDVALNVTHAIAPQFGVYTFTVNVSNTAFPERWNATAFNLTVTPDNMNGFCEPELGETIENTPDCASAFVCGFDGKCERTTAFGIDWSASVTDAAIEQFGVCEFEPGSSKHEQQLECLDELEKPVAERTKLTCSASTGFCHANCAERSGKYFLVARTATANYTSPTFRYGCPACIGKMFSPIVRDDLELHRWRPEFENGQLDFADWIWIVGEGEFLYAMAWRPSLDCMRVAQGIVDQARILNRTAADLLAGLNYNNPVEAQCAATRARIATFIDNSETMIRSVCGGAGIAAFNITRIAVPNVTLGVPANATVEIENPSPEAYAQARCEFEQQGRFGQRPSASSECKAIPTGERVNFSVPISDLALGNWTANCAATWSVFSDCAVVVGVDSKLANVTVVPPNTSLRIASWNVPRYGVQNEAMMIRLDVKNFGEGANASINCTLLDVTGNQREVESETKFVGFNQTVPFRIDVRLDAGDWFVESCSVYKIGSKIWQETRTIGENITVWPACTSECQKVGWDFGGCFSNATFTIGVAGDYGCSATERCACGRLNITEQRCERVGSFGTNGRYNATLSGTWQTGTYLRIGTTFFQNASFEWTRQFTQSGVYSANATVYKGSMPIFFRPIELACIATPLIEIIMPADRSVVSGTVITRANVVDGNASLYIDGLLQGALPAAGYVWNTATVSDGWHTLRVSSCNAAGCSDATRDVRVQNEIVLPRYDFTIDPGIFQSNVRAGEVASLSFVIRNTGTARDSYTLTDELNTTWSRLVAMNGARFVRTVLLDPDQQALFTANISVPATAKLGENASLNVRATSAIGAAIRTSGPHIIRVSDVPNTAPELLNVWHSPMIVYRGETLTFYTQLNDRDGDAIVDVRVCKDASCAQQWCSATVTGSSAGVFNCSITAPLAGNYSYWLFAQDSDGLNVLSSERKFYVTAMPTGPVGKTNAARNGTANASSALAANPPEYAIDGDASTYWVSQSPLPQWLQIDLKRQMWVGGIGIYSSSGARPKAFDVLVGDCANFKNAYSTQNARYVDNWFRVAFDSVLGRCVKLDIKATEDVLPYAAISEFEIYEGQPNIPAGAPLTCGNSVCDAGETTENCAIDCAIPVQPAPGLPIYVYIAIGAAMIIIVLLLRPRISLWLSYVRG